MEFEDIDKNRLDNQERFLNPNLHLNEADAISAVECSFVQHLDVFFQSWQKIHLEQPVLEKTISVEPVHLSNFFDAFKQALVPIVEAKQQGLMLNVWKNSGLGSDEVRNSKVLKWFLDCNGDHGQGNTILVQLLQLLPKPFRGFEPQFYSTIEECCPLGNLENRVDIEIDAPEFLIFIEVKINANEGVKQLQRYKDIAQKKAGGRPWLVVYLTRDGKLPPNYLDHAEGLYGLSWRDIARAFKQQYACCQNSSNRSLWLLSQYADHIKSL